MSQLSQLSLADPSLSRAATLLDQLFRPPRDLGIQLWNGIALPASGNPLFTLVINHPGALRRMFKPPIEVAWGEAFIYRDFDISGDIFSAFGLLDNVAATTFSLGDVATMLRDVLALPRAVRARPEARGPARLRGALHSRERDRAAVQYHYDAGNDFYSLWLNPLRQYSCGYFATSAEDLDTAQARKLEYICRKLRLKPGERLLDIGCGWGGLARYAARNYDVHVLGVTLSQKQMEYANQAIDRVGLGGQCGVTLQDYRDLKNEAFDKIVSFGMFEHVGRSHLPEYFGQVYRLLKPGGLFLNHGISRRMPGNRRLSGWRSILESRLLGAGSFVWRYIFPDGELTPLSEVNELAEAAGFEVRDVENLREHYALTLRHWVNRLESHRAQAVKAAGDVTYRTWRLYMSASARGFEAGNINVNQTLLAKLDKGKSSVPLLRADLSA